MSDTINVSREDFKELKKLYANAVKEELPQFMFKGRVLVTGYAKYLIEYLEPKFNQHQN